VCMTAGAESKIMRAPWHLGMGRVPAMVLVHVLLVFPAARAATTITCGASDTPAQCGTNLANALKNSGISDIILPSGTYTNPQIGGEWNVGVWTPGTEYKIIDRPVSIRAEVGGQAVLEANGNYGFIIEMRAGSPTATFNFEGIVFQGATNKGVYTGYDGSNNFYMNFIDCEFKNNNVAFYGGGLYGRGTFASFERTKFSGNTGTDIETTRGGQLTFKNGEIISTAGWAFVGYTSFLFENSYISGSYRSTQSSWKAPSNIFIKLDCVDGNPTRNGGISPTIEACKPSPPNSPPLGPPTTPPRIDSCGAYTKFNPDSSLCEIDTGDCLDEEARRLSTVDQEASLMAKKKGWSSDDIEILNNLMASDSSYGDTIRTDPSFLDLLMDVVHGMEKEALSSTI